MPVADLLRKALILAARLSHAPLKEWAKLELAGDPGGTPLPEYRARKQGVAKGDFVGLTAMVTGVQISPMRSTRT